MTFRLIVASKSHVAYRSGNEFKDRLLQTAVSHGEVSQNGCYLEWSNISQGKEAIMSNSMFLRSDELFRAPI